MGILTGQPNLLRSLFVPTGQEEKGRYCIKIFKEANWTNVFVDTRVPCDSTGNVSLQFVVFLCTQRSSVHDIVLKAGVCVGAPHGMGCSVFPVCG